ncbi:MAG TPA: hypothetical protein ENJ95_24690 [Bacteroidetes bacterium]|nr:hypothetical protein [Bacteroidota bacterium]
MTEKQIEQFEKLFDDQLTLAVWNESDFKEKLGLRGYQDFIDNILDNNFFLRNLKKELYGKQK